MQLKSVDNHQAFPGNKELCLNANQIFSARSELSWVALASSCPQEEMASPDSLGRSLLDAYGHLWHTWRMGYGVNIPGANFLKDTAGGRALLYNRHPQEPLLCPGNAILCPPHLSLQMSTQTTNPCATACMLDGGDWVSSALLRLRFTKAHVPPWSSASCRGNTCSSGRKS